MAKKGNRRSPPGREPNNRGARYIDGTDADRWDVYLGILMHDVARLRRGVFDEWMKPLGITRSQAWVLAQLGPEDGMSQTKLAEILSVGKAALGIFLDKLEANRLIVRRADALDRRLRRVYLTKDGAQIIKSMRVRLRSMSENILKGLSATDRDQLIHALDKVKANLLSLLEQH